jgi:hypothetical protein
VARLQDKQKAAIIVEARRLDLEAGREAGLDYLAKHGMGGHESNDYASAHRILNYSTFRYVNCVPREHPLWREWRDEEDAANTRRREARKQKPALMERTGGKCEWCGSVVEGRNATVDHIDPDKGNTLDNLALMCRSCNSRKSNGSLERLSRIDEAYRRRDSKAREDGWSSYDAQERFFECPCHHYGCPPDCPGCEMCGHTEHQRPRRIVCDEPWDACEDPRTCWIDKRCRRA